jgi:hypothetical protein
VRTGPLLCLDSRLVREVDYSQLAMVVNEMGFDGCDLDVERGGTLEPDQSPVTLVRAIEVLGGSQIELPLITTSFLDIGEPWARNVLALSGGSGVPYFRTGYSRNAARLAERAANIMGLAAYGRAAGMLIGLPYPAAEFLMRNLDPEWSGYDFDTAAAPAPAALEAALPRTRMFTLRDFRREKEQTVACPLGEGTIDWAGFFGTLARARFSGPLTLQIDYQPEDRLQALRRDLDFARKQLNAAYQKESAPPAPRQPAAPLP